MQISGSIPSSEMYRACEPAPSVPSYQQTRQFPVYEAQEESYLNQLLLDATLEPVTVTDSSISVFQNQYLCFPEGPTQPSPIFYQNMTPESPSDSSDMSNSFEYSPTYQGLEFVPQSYSSPTHQDNRSCAYAGVDHHVYQHHNNSPFCYCAYCCSVDYQESVNVQNSCAYPNTDCMGYLTSLDDAFTRDLTNSDMCYR
ncbi:POU class 2 homeobox associating factor 3 [Mixophyes fleayi]|uniref:POU class 2 homeobox associating factor 3 n=1 Tax=Mixophyes fleayi TaxID=3061075 RepID=UPI003F4DBC7C